MAKQPATETVIDLDDGFVPQQAGALERMRAAGATGPGPDVVDDDENPAAVVVDEDTDESAELPKRARLNPDGSVTLPLRYPRELQIRSGSGGIRTERFDAFTFHRVVGADLKAVSATSDETRPVVMMARSARVRQAVMNALFDRLDGADIADAIAVVASFFPSGRTTGR